MGFWIWRLDLGFCQVVDLGLYCARWFVWLNVCGGCCCCDFPSGLLWLFLDCGYFGVLSAIVIARG